MGINLGDAIADGTDLHGDAVNIAARLQAECPPSGICVSRSVRDHVHGRLGLEFEELGALTLKNIARPVEAFLIKPEAGRMAPLAPPDKPALAVLPFNNMSGDPEQEYFVDGSVEDIITALSRLEWLFVIARNSSFTYKGRAVDVRKVGQELGVRYVLEGSVRKATNRVRITGQLIDATSGAHLWADRFDGSLDDVFDLQDRVTETVAGTIEPRLQRAEIERAKQKSTQHLSAYDYYLRGMARYYERTKASNEAATDLFIKAVECDPEYGMAAECISERKAEGWITEPEREIADGLGWARRAVAVGKDDATALRSAGFALAYLGGETDYGLALIERACVLNPNMANAWCVAGYVQTHLGQPERGIASLERAMRLSPLDPSLEIFYRGVARAYFFTGCFEKAVTWAERALHEMPGSPHALRTLTAAYALAGNLSEAQRVMTLLREAQPLFRLSNAKETLAPYRRTQDIEIMLDGLRLARLPE
jgi:TolB-like protein